MGNGRREKDQAAALDRKFDALNEQITALTKRVGELEEVVRETATQLARPRQPASRVGAR